MTSVKTIPTVDLGAALSGGAGGSGSAGVAATVGAGLREFGFVNVEGHGIEPALIREVYGHWERFFALPEAAKRRYSGVEGGARGFTPFGVEHAKDSPVPDLKEFWHVGQEPPEDHPFRREYPPNVWPAEIPELREPTLRLYRRLERVAATLLRALAAHFELPAETFAAMMEWGNSLLRILHYPAMPPTPMPAMPPGQLRGVRAAAHEDINLITLLCEATGSGLEILTRDGEWLPVDTRPGQIVVDAGDMLSRFTNEVIPATTHRVVNPAGPAAAAAERYSMPFFVHPYSACDLTVHERFVDAGHPPKHPPITAGQFLDRRLREIGLKG
jgi:isopenicillin N synthase-like dioxygenase